MSKKLTFGVDDLSDSARENFIGTIVEANYPCECDMCVKGAESLGEDRKDSLHIQISPLSVYEKRQHEWLVPSKTKLSKWGAFNIRLDELGILKKIKSPKDLVGKTFEFESITTSVGFGDKKVSCWVPVRLLSKKEVDDFIDSTDDDRPDIDEYLPDDDYDDEYDEEYEDEEE